MSYWDLTTDADLLHRWVADADGNATVDGTDVVGSNDATLGGVVTLEPGPVGKSEYPDAYGGFDGNSGSDNRCLFTQVDFAAECTVMGWVYSIGGEFTNWWGGSGNNNERIGNAGGNIRWSINGNSYTTGGGNFTTGAWFHVSCTRDSANDLRVIIDGADQGVMGNTANEANFFCFGALGNGGSPHNGMLADLRIYDRTLSEAEHDEIVAGPEPTNVNAPALSGTEEVGETLTATSSPTTDWDGYSNGTVTLSYQWTRSDDGTGTNEADISGATSSTYTLVSADEDKFIRCRVRATNDGGFDADEDTNTAFSGQIAAGGGGGGSNIPAIANHYRRMRAA